MENPFTPVVDGLSSIMDEIVDESAKVGARLVLLRQQQHALEHARFVFNRKGRRERLRRLAFQVGEARGSLRNHLKLFAYLQEACSQFEYGVTSVSWKHGDHTYRLKGGEHGVDDFLLIMYSALTVAETLTAPLGILTLCIPREERLNAEIITHLQALLREGLAAAETCARANRVAEIELQRYRSAQQAVPAQA